MLMVVNECVSVATFQCYRPAMFVWELACWLNKQLMHCKQLMAYLLSRCQQNFVLVVLIANYVANSVLFFLINTSNQTDHGRLSQVICSLNTENVILLLMGATQCVC